MLCNAVGITILGLYPEHAIAGWFSLLISAGLHLFSFCVSRFIFPEPPINTRLYRLAHLSVTNFVLDTPGRGIKEVRFTHSLIVVLSLVPVLVLGFTWYAITPIEEAWACYDPAYIEGYKDYKYGTCDGGAICARPQINCGRKAKIFSSEVHFFVQMFAALYAMHLAAVPAKIDHYKLKNTLLKSKRQ